MAKVSVKALKAFRYKFGDKPAEVVKKNSVVKIDHVEAAALVSAKKAVYVEEKAPQEPAK